MRDTPPVLEKLLTAREVAELLQLNVKTVERMARAGRLPGLRVCGRVRFRPSDIASWLAAREDRACHEN
jgi:excisionase family DNA binding protein